VRGVVCVRQARELPTLALRLRVAAARVLARSEIKTTASELPVHVLALFRPTGNDMLQKLEQLLSDMQAHPGLCRLIRDKLIEA
jgi:hypothetical protein